MGLHRIAGPRHVLSPAVMQLQEIASSPPDSDLRFHTRALLPGFAKRLRAVGQAAPVVAALATGADRNAVISAAFGGDSASADSPAESVFVAVGSILNYSGSGLQPDALRGPGLAAAGVAALDKLLALLPRQTVEEAQQLRVDARAGQALQ